MVKMKITFIVDNKVVRLVKNVFTVLIVLDMFLTKMGKSVETNLGCIREIGDIRRLRRRIARRKSNSDDLINLLYDYLILFDKWFDILKPSNSIQGSILLKDDVYISIIIEMVSDVKEAIKFGFGSIGFIPIEMLTPKKHLLKISFTSEKP